MRKSVLAKSLLVLSLMSAGAFAEDIGTPPNPPEFDNSGTSTSATDDTSVATSVATSLTTTGTWSVDGYFYKTGDGAWDYTYCVVASDLCLPLLGASASGAFDYDFVNTSTISSMSGDPYGYYIQYDAADANGFGWALAIPSASYLVKLKGATADRTAMEYNTVVNEHASFTIGSDKKTITFTSK